MPTPAQILVVEDDSQIRFLFSEVLSSEGYAVTEAATADEALEKIPQLSSLDMILLDLSIPGMSPDELLSELRARNLSHVPVAIISGWHDVQERASHLGVPYFLRKPVDLDELSALVKKGVETRQKP